MSGVIFPPAGDCAVVSQPAGKVHSSGDVTESHLIRGVRASVCIASPAQSRPVGLQATSVMLADGYLSERHIVRQRHQEGVWRGRGSRRCWPLLRRWSFGNGRRDRARDGWRRGHFMNRRWRDRQRLWRVRDSRRRCCGLLLRRRSFGNGRRDRARGGWRRGYFMNRRWSDARSSRR